MCQPLIITLLLQLPVMRYVSNINITKPHSCQRFILVSVIEYLILFLQHVSRGHEAFVLAACTRALKGACCRFF